jgi:VWFA-related protein
VPEADEIRIDTQLVLSDLLVQDENGVPVEGLTAADFEIREDGVRQDIDLFVYGDSDVPRSIVLVIDHSFSQRPFIDLSISAAKVLVDSMRPRDRMAIVSDDVELISDFTSDRTLLKDRLDGLRLRCMDGLFGKSRQYSALFAALNELTERNGTRNIIVFQTDGDELVLLPTREHSAGHLNFNLNNIVSSAQKKGVTIYSVFTGMMLSRFSKDRREDLVRENLIALASLTRSKNTPAARSKPLRVPGRLITARSGQLMADEAAVTSVAKRTGGIAQSLVAPEDAGQVYDKILSDIGRRYLIGYYAPERKASGSREREVRITLQNRRGYQVVGGRTYIAY